jgi:16S rRNA (cytidine1402-2'-O)-methyltransferase
MSSRLYLVSTPIGNYEDITLRALRILKEVDFIICEEFKEARRLLSYYGIEKPLLSINEHNEKENSDEILQKLLKGESAALISDCGTPLFSDPGHFLFDLCVANKIDVVIIPGVNSLIPAVTGSSLHAEKFYYAGWLSPKKEIRKQELTRLKNLHEVLVFMETPYRLKALLTDVVKYLGKNLPAVIAYQLTMENEKYYRGTAEELLKLVEEKNLKGEFVLLIEN